MRLKRQKKLPAKVPALQVEGGHVWGYGDDTKYSIFLRPKAQCY
jgi:hypothetical protein